MRSDSSSALRLRIPPTTPIPLSSAAGHFAMSKAFGYFFVVLSFLPWAAIAALPFFDISIGMAAGITTGLIVGGEVSFLLGLALLGKEAWGRIRAAFKNGNR